ncbi:MAG: hypothetical protein WAZ27_00435 [Minisyncoccia bacterium]
MARLATLGLLFLPLIVSAAPRTFAELAGTTVGIINAAIGATIILGLVIYFYGIASGVAKLQSGGVEELRTRIVWGLVAIFVMVSVWGIVGLIRNTLFGGGGGGIDSGFTETRCAGGPDCLE